MCGSVLLDQFHVNLFLPPNTDAAVVEAIRTALENACLTDAIAEAVQTILSAVPALASLTVCVDS